ncbi:MAG: hypothetical protein M3Q45_13905 [Chloroflexota bacterium]|nr:hypothetical protein [Chloroflexota bacterium]
MSILFLLNTLFELIVAISAAFVLNNFLLAGNALALTTLSALLINVIDRQPLRGVLVFHHSWTRALIVSVTDQRLPTADD